MLYWAEGSKGRHAIGFTNSDARMLLPRRFLTEAMAIERDELLLTINVYTNNGLTSRRSSDIGWTCLIFRRRARGST